MNRMRLPSIAIAAGTVVLALCLAPQAAAGNAQDPEVTDPRGDHTGGVQQDPFNGWDVRYIFFQDPDPDADCAADTIRVQMGLQNIFTMHAESPGAEFSNSVYFTINDNAYRTYFRPPVNLGPSPADPWIYMYDITNAATTRIIINGGVDNGSGQEFIYWCVPYAKLNGAEPGDVVTKIWGRTYSDELGVVDVAPDGAPGSGTFGREYALGGVTAPEANLTVEVLNETLDPVPVGGLIEVTINLTNHAPENDTVNLTVANITEGWNATLPANVTLPGNSTVQVNVTVAAEEADPNQTASVEVVYESQLGANGSIEFQVTAMEPEPPAGPAEAEPSGSAPDASPAGQDDEATPSEGVPGPSAWLALLMAAGAAALSRRRTG